MIKIDSPTAGSMAVTFSMGRKPSESKDKSTNSVSLKKKKSNFDAQQALRKVAMAETKQSLRGVINSLRSQELKAGQYEDGAAMAAKVKNVLRKARQKMAKLSQEQQLAKQRDEAKKHKMQKLGGDIHNALQRQRLNRRIQEWNDVNRAGSLYGQQNVEAFAANTVDVVAADTASVATAAPAAVDAGLEAVDITV